MNSKENYLLAVKHRDTLKKIIADSDPASGVTLALCRGGQGVDPDADELQTSAKPIAKLSFDPYTVDGKAAMQLLLKLAEDRVLIWRTWCERDLKELQEVLKS